MTLFIFIIKEHTNNNKKGDFLVELKDRIKKIRKNNNLTQQEFAKKIGTSQNVLANWENGRRNPSASAVNNICKTFNITEEWLRTGKGEMYLELDTEEELFQWVEKVLNNRNTTFKKRFVAMLMSLSDQEWEFLEKKALELIDNNYDYSIHAQYNTIPDTPEELERLYPPIDPSDLKQAR